MLSPKYTFKIRFNTEYHKTPGLCWRVLINEVEHLVSDVEINTLQVKTLAHVLPTGERKWSIYCESSEYRIDEEKKMFIYQ